MKYIYIIIAFLTFAGTANAQIKIGNTTAPEKFSVLEIDALKTGEPTTDGRIIGGLRLPQWDDAKAVSMVTELTAKSPSSDGLLIYNKDKSHIQMWNGTAWIPLPQKGCTSVQTLTLAANQVTFSEYGPDDLVLTATPDANVSGNADIVYRWTLNSNPIEGATGKTYTVKKENLSAAHSGTYQVTAYSCGFTGTISDVNSNILNVTVTPKTYSMSLAPASQSVNSGANTLNFTCTAVNYVPTELVAVDDPERVYTAAYTITPSGVNQYKIQTSIPANRGNRSGYSIKFKLVDDKGNESNVVTVTQAAYTFSGSGYDDAKVVAHFVYGAPDNNANDAVEYCRSRVWSSPKRASLMSVDFLNENKDALETAPGIIAPGNYWVLETGIPTMVNVSYPSGVLVVTPQSGEPETNTHIVRCIAPY